jgi:dihydrolipoamide dehydrogenase
MNQEIKKFDIAVLGGGPGGYPAAIRAAQHGKTVALIEAKDLGGTCLNRGCIPSKALIASAELFHKCQHTEALGVHVGSVSFDYSQMNAHKDQVVMRLRQGLEGLISANKITLFRGYGQLTSPQEIKVQGQDQALIRADKIILATGSEPRNLSAFPFDYEKIHDSTSMLALKEVPRSLVVIGGGIIGCEFASMHSLLGANVTILELLPRLLPMEAENISDVLTKAFLKRGIKVETNAHVLKVERQEQGVEVLLEENRKIRAESVLIAVGRSLNTKNIGLEKAGVVVQDNGMVAVNEKMETSVPGIYAVGDIASKWWLAHVASEQGIVAADNATGHSARMFYHAIPSAIFTYPEIATVGLSLEEALKQGYQAITGTFPFQALGKSLAIMEPEGFAQIITDRKTRQILGAQVVGYEASSLISEMTTAIANELTLDSLMETIHAHPTLAEAWHEAALMANGTPLHFPPKISKRSH